MTLENFLSNNTNNDSGEIKNSPSENINISKNNLIHLYNLVSNAALSHKNKSRA